MTLEAPATYKDPKVPLLWLLSEPTRTEVRIKNSVTALIPKRPFALLVFRNEFGLWICAC